MINHTVVQLEAVASVRVSCGKPYHRNGNDHRVEFHTPNSTDQGWSHATSIMPWHDASFMHHTVYAYAYIGVLLLIYPVTMATVG